MSTLESLAIDWHATVKLTTQLRAARAAIFGETECARTDVGDGLTDDCRRQGYPASDYCPGCSKRQRAHEQFRAASTRQATVRRALRRECEWVTQEREL